MSDGSRVKSTLVKGNAAEADLIGWKNDIRDGIGQA